MLKPEILFAVFTMASNVLFAQSPDTLFVASAKYNSAKSYEDVTVVQSGLFNGSQYTEPRRTNADHPFFITEEWVEGDVHYKGQYYQNLSLLYDVTTDKLVSELFNGQPFALVREHVESFRIGDHSFVRIDNEAVNNSLPASGFYEIFYNGPTKVVARHWKHPEEYIEDLKVQVDYKARVRYYMLVNGGYVRVSNKRSVLKLFPGHKGELRQFIQKNKLVLKSTPLPQSLAKVAAYSDTLKKDIK